MKKEMPTGGVIVDPGSTVRNKTGDWRTFKPVWDKEKCKQCMICWQFCPDDSIPLDENGKRVETDLDFCKGCGICAKECPFGAIKMVREEK